MILENTESSNERYGETAAFSSGVKALQRGVRCRIHRGCNEIGGNCVEIEAGGKRIVLDLGLPLNGDRKLPHVDGLTSPDENLLGIFISHPHPDHYGLLERIHESVPVYMGHASNRIIEVSSFFTPLTSIGNVNVRGYADRKPIHVGPFTVTPIRIDHSAYDSYCLLVEVDGRRILYSGDIRGHGRNAHLFDELVAKPPQDIDVLICEGTQVGRIHDFAYPDENSVADRMVEIFEATEGMCLVWCSSQNIDRLVSVWQACQRSNRKLILDMYTAELVRAVGDDRLPKPGKKGVTVFLPSSQRSRIKRERAFHISNPYYPYRVYPDALRNVASESVMLFRPSILRDLQSAECLDGASLISSVWSGYVHRSHEQLDQMQAMGIERIHVHTSGHATVNELQRFVQAIPATRIIPIHLEDRVGFAELSSRVDSKNDHDWWKV
jgi:ribonuclease J